MKNAIKLAIEGGWDVKISSDGRPYTWHKTGGRAIVYYLPDAEIRENPLFWQALIGKGKCPEGSHPAGS